MVGTLIRRPLPPVSDFIRTLLDDADATTALATLGIVTGTYTPTHFLNANLAASTSYTTNYLRVGNRVIVSGIADADPTTAAFTCQLGVSLPVASNFAATTDCTGVVGAGGVTESGAITADTAGDVAVLSFIAAGTANHGIGFVFMYRVI